MLALHSKDTFHGENSKFSSQVRGLILSMGKIPNLALTYMEPCLWMILVDFQESQHPFLSPLQLRLKFQEMKPPGDPKKVTTGLSTHSQALDFIGIWTA